MLTYAIYGQDDTLKKESRKHWINSGLVYERRNHHSGRSSKERAASDFVDVDVYIEYNGPPNGITEYSFAALQFCVVFQVEAFQQILWLRRLSTKWQINCHFNCLVIRFGGGSDCAGLIFSGSQIP